MPPYRPLEQRFWEKVSKSDDGCWLWTGSHSDFGHGTINAGRSVKMLRAHRVSWELHHGAVPDGLCVLHRCDVPGCVRPEHLFLGTKRDNTADMWAKGRHVAPPLKRGEDGARTKLSAQHVLEIRAARGLESNAALARRYGVADCTISAIHRRRLWAHL